VAKQAKGRGGSGSGRGTGTGRGRAAGGKGAGYAGYGKGAGHGRAAGGAGNARGGADGEKRGSSRQPKRDHDLIEGRRAVAEALDAGIPLKKAIVLDQQQGERDAELDRLVRRLEADDVAIEYAKRRTLDSLSSHGAHQGIVVRAQKYRYAAVEEVIAAAGEGDALVVLLDHVTDEGNLGAIIRSAEVVGASGVIVAKARAAGVGPATYKTSAGAVLHLPVAQASNLASAIELLKEAGFWVCGCTEHAEQSVWDAPLEGRICLVMGSEGDGISRLVRERCDFECKLPQRGRIESLNVAQATTVLCYEWLRRTTEREAAAGVVEAGEAMPAVEAGE